MFSIRLSREDDAEDILRLIKIGFSEKNPDEILEGINGRYLLAVDRGFVIAMTGLIWSKEFQRFEIDWTVTHPKYRGQGIMHELFKRLCQLTDDEIYCSCWRPSTNANINLKSLMHDFGFEEVMVPRVIWDTRYNCRNACKTCVRKRDLGGYCRCQEDLYVRPRLS